MSVRGSNALIHIEELGKTHVFVVHSRSQALRLLRRYHDQSMHPLQAMSWLRQRRRIQNSSLPTESSMKTIHLTGWMADHVCSKMILGVRWARRRPDLWKKPWSLFFAPDAAEELNAGMLAVRNGVSMLAFFFSKEQARTLLQALRVDEEDRLYLQNIEQSIQLSKLPAKARKNMVVVRGMVARFYTFGSQISQLLAREPEISRVHLLGLN